MSGGTRDARRAIWVERDGQPRSYSDGQRNVTFVPLMIKRRHNHKVVAPPHGAASATAATSQDLQMIKMLGKAFHWQRLIDTGQYASGNELARAFKLEPGYVAEMLRLTLLAPDIVEAILDGRQPRHVYPHLIKGRIEHLPRDWSQQREVLGFTQPCL